MLITYDVNITSPHGEKRLRNVARVCLNYGKRVQNSVFECILTEAQFVVLRDQLKGIIDSDQDSIRFYMLGKTGNAKLKLWVKIRGLTLLVNLSFSI